jgi:hypothetical protein
MSYKEVEEAMQAIEKHGFAINESHSGANWKPHRANKLPYHEWFIEMDQRPHENP